MPRYVDVTLDKNTMSTSLIFSDSNDSAFDKLILYLNTLPNSDYRNSGFVLPWHYFKKNITTIARILKINEIDFRFDNYSESLINIWLEDRENYEKGKKFLSLSEVDLEEKLSLSGFKRQLTLEQKRDVLHLLELKHGANFSVPGAGKTTTLLAVHTILKSKGFVNILWVVCPISAFLSWEDEIQLIYTDLLPKYIRLRNRDLENFHLIEKQKPDILLINYEKLRKNAQAL
jgi:hypothetical protein